MCGDKENKFTDAWKSLGEVEVRLHQPSASYGAGWQDSENLHLWNVSVCLGVEGQYRRFCPLSRHSLDFATTVDLDSIRGGARAVTLVTWLTAGSARFLVRAETLGGMGNVNERLR